MEYPVPKYILLGMFMYGYITEKKFEEMLELHKQKEGLNDGN